MQLSVRDVNEKVFRTFKAHAVRQGVNVGKALTLAMEHWVEEEKGSTKSFLDLKPVHWGKGTEHSSEEIDKVLYGG
jgi:hypothetical protein